MRRHSTILACGAAMGLAMLLAGGCNNVKWPWQQAEKPAAVDMGQVEVTASGHEKSQWGDFGPSLVTDGNFAAASSWRVEGRGQWIHFDLKQVCTVSAVQAAFMKGKDRKYTFAIELSADGARWQRVFEGQSSGASADLEKFAFTPTQTRYVKLVGGGNTDPEFADWFNLTEVKIEAAPAAKG